MRNPDIVPVELPLSSVITGFAVGENSVTIFYRQNNIEMVNDAIIGALEDVAQPVAEGEPMRECPQHGLIPVKAWGGHMSYYHRKGGLKTAQKNRKRRATTAKKRTARKRITTTKRRVARKR